MSTHVDALHLRRVWGRADWLPPEPYGADGWLMTNRDHDSSIIVTCAPWEENIEWLHASISHREQMPSYEDLARLHASVWKGRGYSYQVFAPSADHVNIHEHALHLWGRLDGKRVLPDFGVAGTI